MLIRLSLMIPSPTQRFIPRLAFVAATIQTLPSLENADPPFTAGPPLLAVAEPPLPLVLLSLLALGGAIGNRHLLHAYLLRRRFVVRGVQSGIGRRQTGGASQCLLMTSIEGTSRSESAGRFSNTWAAFGN